MVVQLHSSSPPVETPKGSERPGDTESSDPALRSVFAITVPHASGDIPDWLRPLAGAPEWRSAAGTHHALDRGAAALARALGALLGADVVQGECSRLFIDLNRPLDDPSAIVSEIDGQALAFNRTIAPGDLASRRSAHRRYHKRVAASVESTRPSFLVDQHSFDRHGPAPTARNVDVGVCAPGDDVFARHLLAALLARTEPRGSDDRPAPSGRRLNVRLNEPYSADHPGAYIMRRHGSAVAGGVVIEVCDDLLCSDQDVAAVAGLLAEGLSAAAALAGTASSASTHSAGECA